MPHVAFQAWVIKHLAPVIMNQFRFVATEPHGIAHWMNFPTSLRCDGAWDGGYRRPTPGLPRDVDVSPGKLCKVPITLGLVRWKRCLLDDRLASRGQTAIHRPS